MITRARALARSPGAWVLVGPSLALFVVTAAWNAGEHLVDRIRRTRGVP